MVVGTSRQETEKAIELFLKTSRKTYRYPLPITTIVGRKCNMGFAN